MSKTNVPPKPEEYRYIQGKFGNGKIPMCGCKRVKCRDCGRRFPKEEHELDDCPDCGKERYCTNARIKDPQNSEKWLPCSIHGGKSFKSRGAASPMYKGGKYSKYLPSRLLESYTNAKDDPEILSLNDDIALTEARVTDVLQRVDANESGAMWDELSRLSKEIKLARKSGDPVLVEDLFDQMLKLIDKGKGDRENWREIGDLMERKRKLSESQLKLLVTKQEFISRQQAVAMISLITNAIKESVSDPKEKRQIMSALQQLMNIEEGQSPGTISGIKTLT